MTLILCKNYLMKLKKKIKKKKKMKKINKKIKTLPIRINKIDRLKNYIKI